MARLRLVALLLGGVAIVLLVAGLVLGMFPPKPDCDGASNLITCQDQAYDRLRISILAMWGVGIAVAVAGMVVWGMDMRQRGRQPPPQPTGRIVSTKTMRR